jgi:hypothetical protein
MLAVLCILAWRVFWLTMLNRVAPNTAPRVGLYARGSACVGLPRERQRPVLSSRTHPGNLCTPMGTAIGDLARAGDGPPGTMVMSLGLARLTDIALGFQLGAKLRGY